MTTWEQGPVRWLNRHAVVQLPARVDQSNAELVRQQLQSVVPLRSTISTSRS